MNENESFQKGIIEEKGYNVASKPLFFCSTALWSLILEFIDWLLRVRRDLLAFAFLPARLLIT